MLQAQSLRSIRPPPLLLLFWQAHAQVIGRLAVSVAAVPLVHIQCGCHPVPEEMAVFNVENLGKLGRDLAQKKAFASPRPLVIKRICHFGLATWYFVGFSTQQ